MTSSASIMLFQTDLRLADNPALSAALRRRHPLICLFVWDPQAEGYAMPGAASRWWLYHSLCSLSANLQKLGNTLLIRVGHVHKVLSDLLDVLSNAQVFWNRSCEFGDMRSDHRLSIFLETKKIESFHFFGNTLLAPTLLQTKNHTPYRVFTPFWKRLKALGPLPLPLPLPRALPSPPNCKLKSESIASLGLLPTVDWTRGIRERWSPGEQGALKALQHFLKTSAPTYARDRDRPDYSHTSRLSPHIHFGEVGPRTLWHKINAAKRKLQRAEDRNSYETYLRQLVWREFAQYLLFHFPQTVHEPLDTTFKKFPYQEHPDFLRCWQKGLTGYPIVDAGMRELWHTGWMHNRVRMITASFLTKHLLIPWQNGAAWFWDTLVDADLANNAMGWQWMAGCGADASPFFRIFNPITQGMKFDPDGRYVRKWVPELADLPSPWIHQPWETPPLLLTKANICLGETYPYPIIAHAAARNRALLAYRKFKKGKSSLSTPASKDQEKVACL